MFSKIKATKQSRNTRHISTSFPSQIARAKARSESKATKHSTQSTLPVFFPSPYRIKRFLQIFSKTMRRRKNFEWKNLPHSPLSRNWLNIERKNFDKARVVGSRAEGPRRWATENLSIGTEDMVNIYVLFN